MNQVKYLLVGIFLMGLIACAKEEKRNLYYLVIEQDSYSPLSMTYEPETETDTFTAVSDSAAYWNGVYTEVAHLRTIKALQGKSVNRYKGFDILDSNRLSILPYISEDMKLKGREFIRTRVDEYNP